MDTPRINAIILKKFYDEKNQDALMNPEQYQGFDLGEWAIDYSMIFNSYLSDQHGDYLNKRCRGVVGEYSVSLYHVFTEEEKSIIKSECLNKAISEKGCRVITSKSGHLEVTLYPIWFNVIDKLFLGDGEVLHYAY